MKISTKVFVLLAMPMLVSLSTLRAAETAPATPEQSHSRVQEMREQRMKKLDEKLHLTDEQKAKINAVWDKTEQDVRAAKKEAAAAERDERRAKLREGMKAARQEVRAILTPEQQKIFDAMPQDRPHTGAHPAGEAK